MKKLLFFSACVLLAFSSCKKDSVKTSSSNTITATVGGLNINFNTTAQAGLLSDSGAYILEIGGLSATGSNAQLMLVSLISDAPIVKGTYTLNASNDSTVTVIPGIEYGKNVSGNPSDLFDTEIFYDVNGATLTTTTTVTITSISSTNVQGTFNGVLVNEADNVTTETVTNGKFNVNISANNNLQSFSNRLSAAKIQSFKKRLSN